MQSPILSAELAAVILAAAKLIGKSLDPATAIEGMLRLLSDRLSLDKGRVVLPDRDSGLLRITYSHGLDEEETRKGIYGLGEGITGRVMATGEIALIPNVANEPAYLSRITPGATDRAHPVAYIAVPILQHDAPAGVLAVQRNDVKNTRFEGDLYVLQIMAAMVGQILHIHALVTEQTTQLRQENERLRQLERIENGAVHGIVGRSPALKRALSDAKKAAASQATVMLVGESGCGKERFARMIHLASERRDQPFVCINCAAIPANLLEAELFGHEKGSFTGAVSARRGKFEIASGGSLFLDEIGDMAPDLQAKLLRVLQEKTVQPLGASRETRVDVRIISATNKQLEEAVKTGEFRLDLYYRLNVIRIPLPPLRECDGDIDLLALYFLARYNQQQHRNVVLSRSALRSLSAYDWPGNVRQLENVIERLVIMSDQDYVDDDEIQSLLQIESSLKLNDLPTAPQDGADNRSGDHPEQPPRPYRKVRLQEREHILSALNHTNGNKTLAARRLGISPRQLHYRLTKLNIDV